MKNKKHKALKRVLLILIVLCLLGGGYALTANLIIICADDSRIISVEQAAALEDVDCILVLGCGVRDDGTPSLLLQYRIDKGIEVYEAGAAPKLLMSGDHGQQGYDEVGTMKTVAIAAGVPSSDIFMDHAGFSTYESMYRAAEIFGVKKMIIVTQPYHLTRALYDAKAFGIEAYGVAADTPDDQFRRDIREIAARMKDVAWCIVKPEPKYLGDAIPVSGDGDATND